MLNSSIALRLGNEWRAMRLSPRLAWGFGALTLLILVVVLLAARQRTVNEVPGFESGDVLRIQVGVMMLLTIGVNRSNQDKHAHTVVPA